MRNFCFAVLFSVIIACTSYGQSMDPNMDMSHMNMPGMEHCTMGMATSNLPGVYASGTSLEPSSTPQRMLDFKKGKWSFMLHGRIFLVEEQQSGKKGGDKFFSTNWLMLEASHKLGKGELAFSSMLTAEPATVTGGYYPLLFQTGETARGRAISNGQHPHDLFMEIAVRYTLPLGKNTSLVFYGGPVADPALGPPAAPHRESASNLPEMALSHHHQDSTHISFGVVTVGIAQKYWRLEGSAFNGHEPDERRWGFDPVRLNSFSTRLTLSPSKNWTGQVSYGRLDHPEALEPGDVERLTASVGYNRAFKEGNWATTVVWGRNASVKHFAGDLDVSEKWKFAQERNHRQFTEFVRFDGPSFPKNSAAARFIWWRRFEITENSNAYLAESNLRFRAKNAVFGRMELFDWKDDAAALHGRVFAGTLGAVRDLASTRLYTLALGADATFYRLPQGTDSQTFENAFGPHPIGARIFLRIQLGK